MWMRRGIGWGFALFLAAMTWAWTPPTFAGSLTVGSGSQTITFVLDPNISNLVSDTVFVYYSWNGSQNAVDFLNQTQALTTRLQVEWHPNFVNSALFGMGFDVDGDGLNITVGIPQDAPGGGPGSENGQSNDPDDWYHEGWFTNGYWSFWTSDDAGTTWDASFSGLGDVNLEVGKWYGLSWAPNFDATAPTVPEPATAALLLAGVLWTGRRNRPSSR